MGMWSNANSKYCTNSKLWSRPLENINRWLNNTPSNKKCQHNVNDWCCVEIVLTLCWHQNLEILCCVNMVLTLYWYCVEKFGVCTIYWSDHARTNYLHSRCFVYSFLLSFASILLVTPIFLFDHCKRHIFS